jgi:hypothetical protein
MASLSKPYDRAEVLDRLKRHGVRVEMLNAEGISIPSSVELHQWPGLKLWSYIESLGIPVTRRPA